MGRSSKFGGKAYSKIERDAIMRWDAERRRHRSGRPTYANQRHRSRSPFALARRFYGVAALLLFGVVAGGQQVIERLQAQPPAGSGLVSLYSPPASTDSSRDRRLVSASRHFPLCGSGKRVNCVVDGDTFWLDGEKIRVLDIDAPEVSEPRGHDATLRLQQHLNSGRIELHTRGRDKDRYGRSLRTVHVRGRSVGEAMIDEGLARRWN